MQDKDKDYIPPMSGEPRECILKLGQKITDRLGHKVTADDPEYWGLEAAMDALAMIFKSPAQRQMMLDPAAPEVDRYDLNATEANKRHTNVSGVSYIHVPGSKNG